MISFCRRGALREGEELVFTHRGINTNEAENVDPNDPEVMQATLTQKLKEKLTCKQNAVGYLKIDKPAKLKAKGKFDVTVPTDFDFMKPARLNKSPSIRQQKTDA